MINLINSNGIKPNVVAIIVLRIVVELMLMIFIMKIITVMNTAIKNVEGNLPFSHRHLYDNIKYGANNSVTLGIIKLE